MPARQSLRLRLPLLISALLGLVLVAVSWSAYRQLERVLVSASAERLSSVTLRVAGMFDESLDTMRGTSRELALTAPVTRLLAQPDTATHAEVARLLEQTRARMTQPAAIALWRRDGRRVLAVGPAASVAAATVIPEPAGRTRRGPWIGPLVQGDSGVGYVIVTPVIPAPGDTIGFIVAHRRLRPVTTAQVISLIGSDATLMIGNAKGGLWSDLQRIVPAPPAHVTHGAPGEYTTADGARQIGLVVPIRAAPWSLWVQMPRESSLATARPFLLGLIGIGLGFMVLGTIATWVLIRRVTAPLVEVTHAAEDVARGDYARRVAVTRRDELGSLALSFNSMAAQVEASSRALQAHAAEVESANLALARANEELRAGEERYRRLVEAAHEGICAVDASGVITFANARLAEMLGCDAHAMTGRSLFDFMDAEAAHEGRARLARRERGGVEPREVAFHRMDGSIAWTRASVSPLLDASGALVGALYMLTDVTEQRALEAQLLHAQKMEAVGQLAGGVAHDFNNLLTIVTSYSGLLLAELPEEDPARADVQEIRGAAERAAGLTRQLLAFSRQQVLDPRVLDLNDVVRDIERMLGRVLREDVRLDTVLAESLGRVYADPGQIEQVIVNLVVNARDAMPRGGALTIETADVELSEEYGRLHPDVEPGPYVMLAVSDTGTGMDAATQARIFEPFFTTKGVGQGTGLGLSTVYGIVKQSGGHVWVYSEPGFGTTFKLYLPRASAPDAAPRRVSAESSVQHGSETVLLVEDDAQVRQAAHRILTRAGYVVLEASDGAEALRLAGARARAVDLLLTDMVMPDMSGRELASLFRARYPDVGIAYMSGYTEDTVVRQGGFESGTVFVPKPFTPQSLTAKLRQALAHQRPAPGIGGGALGPPAAPARAIGARVAPAAAQSQPAADHHHEDEGEHAAGRTAAGARPPPRRPRHDPTGATWPSAWRGAGSCPTSPQSIPRPARRRRTAAPSSCGRTPRCGSPAACSGCRTSACWSATRPAPAAGRWSAGAWTEMPSTVGRVTGRGGPGSARSAGPGAVGPARGRRIAPAGGRGGTAGRQRPFTRRRRSPAAGAVPPSRATRASPMVVDRSSPAAARYARAMRPCLSDDAFDRERALGAIVTLVRDLEAEGEAPDAIVRLAEELLPLGTEARESVFAITLRDWIRTTARRTLRGPVLDRRAATRLPGP